MNLWEGIGRITKDIELRQVGDKNTDTCSFTIAVDRKYKTREGERLADFIPVTCWGQNAKFVHDFFNKGNRILVIGSLQSRTYDDKDGKKVYVIEIIAESCEFVDTKKDLEPQRPSVPSSGAAKVNSYLPPEIDSGFYPAMDDDTTLPFNL
jgi:single-strand DNA-binding protein